jgi:Na+-transporting NADH:ubiquinone oxidoreductase subunit NqrC
MKRVLLSVLVVLVVGIFLLGIRYELKKQAQKRREATYQSELHSYSLVLKPGMKRKEIEDYLRAKNADFSQMCCVDTSDSARRHSWDDLVKIGEEEHPWFCSEHFVYVAFRFVDHVQVETGYSFKDDDSDTLRTVSIFHQLGGCL